MAFNVHDKFVGAGGFDAGKGSPFGIRFGIINENVNLVHHLLLFACTSKPKIAGESQASEATDMPCSDLRYAWAVGAKDFCLPSGVGIEFDIADRDKSWYLLEMHYDNPGRERGIIDR